MKLIEATDATGDVNFEEMKNTVESADVLLVSGGNTLYATDLWHRLKLAPLLVEAAKRGAVLTGGSAGASKWHVFL